MLNGFKAILRKTVGAATLQGLLEHVRDTYRVPVDAAALANRLVENLWHAYPDIYGGRFGRQPHKLTTVALALKVEVHRCMECGKTAGDYFFVLNAALSDVLKSYEVNGRLYPFTSMDHELFGLATQTYFQAMEGTNVSNDDRWIDALL